MKSDLVSRIEQFNITNYPDSREKFRADLEMLDNLINCSIQIIQTIDEMFIFFQTHMQKLRQKIIKTTLVKGGEDTGSGIEN